MRGVASNQDLDPTAQLPLKCFYDVFLFDDEPWFRATYFSVLGGPAIAHPFFGSILRRRGSRLERVLGRGDTVNSTSLFYYQPVLADRDLIVLFVGDQPSQGDTGLYEFDLLNAGLAIPTLSTISLAVFSALLLLVAFRRI